MDTMKCSGCGGVGCTRCISGSHTLWPTGTRVRYRDLTPFSNGSSVATIAVVEGKEAKLKETSCWAMLSQLERVTGEVSDAKSEAEQGYIKIFNEARAAAEAAKPTGKIASDGGTTDYYKLPAFATELRHLIAHKKMNFHIGNIFKAAYRLGEKQGIDHRYDLKKIISMAQFELEELDRAEGKI